MDLSEHFAPAPKPGAKEPKPPTAKTAKAPVKPKRKPKKVPSSSERRAYTVARDRCRTAGGYICERCGGHIKEGMEHAHHIIWGRAHGTRNALTDPDLLGICHGDLTEESCHHRIHQSGEKTPEALPFWRGSREKFESLRALIRVSSNRSNGSAPESSATSP